MEEVAKTRLSTMSTIKDLVEAAMPGWTMVERNRTAEDSVGSPSSDFVGKDLETIKNRYGAADVAAPVDAGAAGESGFVRLRSERGQGDPVLGTRTVVVVNGSVSGVQG